MAGDGMNLPDEKKIGQALNYLGETDESYAQAKARVKALEHTRKIIKAGIYLDAEGTNGEREQKAYADTAYKEWVSEYEDAILDEQTLGAKRKRAELTIEVWRSLNSARSKGIMI